MSYKPTIRTVLNRERLQDVDRAMATGLERLAEDVLERADVPDAPPYGVGLIENGAYISYVDGKRIGGTADKKPKSFKVRGRGVSIAVGYPFPARFNEMGTVKQPARPFIAPAVIAVLGNRALVEEAVKAGLAANLSKRAARQERDARRAARRAGGRPKPAGNPFDFGTFMKLQKGFAGL
jgi:hypothetical protein